MSDEHAMVRPEEASYGVLAEMVAQLRYKPGWTFHLHWGPSSAAVCTQMDIQESMYGSVTRNQPARGNTVAEGVAAQLVFSPDRHYWTPLILTICVLTDDAWNPGKQIMVEHPQMVPQGEYHPPWHRWLLECIRLVENHEIGEHFEIAGQRPFYPEHGPGADLYYFKDRGLEWPGLKSGAAPAVPSGQ